MTTVNTLLDRAGSSYAMTLVGRELPLRALRGVEGLSRPARFDAVVASDPDTLPDLGMLSGTVVTLVVRRYGEIARRIPLAIAEVVLDVTTSGTVDIEAVLESRHARLRHRIDNRIFRDRTTPTIVAELLAESNIDVELRLRATYPVRPYTVQWNESTLDFVHRLLEEEGISYVVADAGDPADGDAGARRDRLILCDGRHAWSDPVALPFLPRAKLERETSAVTSLRSKARMVAGSVLVRDFSTARPDQPIEGTARVPSSGAAAADVYLYPGAVDDDGVASQRARAAAEALAAEAEGFDGVTDALATAPGTVLAIADVPHFGDASGGLELLVTHLRHEHLDRDEGQSSALLAFSALVATGTTHRPSRSTAKPLAPGFQEAIVCGPAGEDIHTDAMGRVKVHFPWDRHLPYDDIASDWVPVLQDNTGTSAAIPRIGWEVLVGFVDGDPDRPVVAGRLYNPQDPFPEPLPAGKTRTAIRSLSSPTRDGENAIVLEDAAGQELIKLRAEKDREILVANDKREMVRDTDAEIVVKDQTVKIGNDRTTTIAESVLRYVSGDEKTTVGGSRSQKIGNGDQQTVDGASTLKVGSTHIRRVGGEDKVTSKSSLSELIGGVVVEASLKDNTTTAEMVETLTVGGAVVEIAGKDKLEQAEMLRVETIGGMVATTMMSAYSLKVKGARSTTTARLGIDAVQSAAAIDPALGPPPPSTLGLSATTTFEVKARATASITAKKKEIVIQVKETTVTLSAAGLTIKTPGNVSIVASAGAGKITGDKAFENK